MYYREKSGAASLAVAAEWYLKAANQGHATAQTNIGRMYRNGQGVTKDYSQAWAWFRKAADQGHADAQSNIGWMYLNGFGVTKDYRQAVDWFRKAANRGNPWAQYNLGYRYENGEGVRRNHHQAMAWFKKAADQGHAGAQAALKQLGRYSPPMFLSARSSFLFQRMEKLLEEVGKLETKFDQTENPKQKAKLLKKIVELARLMKYSQEEQVPKVQIFGKVDAKLN